MTTRVDKDSKMYTGYFAKLKTYQENGLIPISICGKAPDWYTGYQFKTFAPKWAFFNEWKNGSHKGDNDYYITHFNAEVLAPLDYTSILNKLVRYGDLDKIVLLCYEKPGDFCHRHLVAKWLTECGTECKEWE